MREIHLVVGGVTIRRQPPVRVRYHGPGLQGVFSAPVDSWRFVNRTLLRMANAMEGRADLVLVDYCKPPSSGKVDRPCGYEAASCRGASELCVACGFHFCQTHGKAHARRVQAPLSVWKRLLASYEAQLAAAARAGGKKPIIVRPTDLVELG